MAINFPEPVVDDTYLYGGKQWICTSTNPAVWKISSATETGNTEGNTGEVAYYDTNGSIIKGATAFYYDATNLKVGIGTSGPDQTLGISGDFYVSGGATFGGNVVVATGGFLQWPDGTTQSTRENITFQLDGDPLSPTDEPHRTLDIWSGGDRDISIVSSGTPLDTARYIFSLGANVPKLDAENGNVFEQPIGTYRYTGNENTSTTILAKLDHASSTYMGVTGGLVNFKILGTHILDMDSDIHAFVGLSADAGATFGGDVIINDLTVGRGGGDVGTNTAVGYQALNSNTSGMAGGNSNVATGYQALYSNTEGDYNVATGYYALRSNTEGDSNVASGYKALYSNTEGDYNVATGYKALYSNTEGDNNSALGASAGYNGTTGSNNTYLGYNAQPSSATVNNEIVLGDSNVTLIHSAAGMSMGGGATFGGDVNILGGLEVGGYWAGEQKETIGISVNNGSSVLTTGVKGHRTLPYACDIVDWRVTSTESVEGEIDWGINYCTYANFPTMTAITQSHHTENTQLVSGDSNKAESADDIAGQWNKYQFDAGDIIEFEIDSVTTLTNCILELTIRRTV